ncbi:MAG: type VI secretion system tip protein VgrG [Rhizobacter sp.]|nr:type VI secretion system tip protein VgrG [Rhizobacter sp.]
MNDRLSDAISSVQSQLAGLLAAWTQSKRLYNVEGDGPVNDLMVEKFTLIDNISEPFVLQLTVLTLDARLSLAALELKRITLTARLSDGSLKKHSGLIAKVTELGSDGGFHRLQLTVQPWIAFLTHGSHSRAWQQKTVPQILGDVFGAYSSHAAWRFGEVAPDGSTEDLDAFLSRGPNAGVLDYCCQYRETDLAFVQRLLASVGLGWRIEESEEALCGHTLVVFADSTRWPENTTSASAIGGQGIKFHRSAATEEQDSLQAFGGQRSLNPAATAVLQWDYLQKSAVSVLVPTDHQFGAQPVQDMAAWLESYETSGTTADCGNCTTAQLQHLATLGQQAHEFRNKTWLARSSVRSLRAGQWFKLKNSTLDALSDLGKTDSDLEFTVHSVHSLGINNLPKELSDKIAQGIANAPAHFDFFADESRPDPMAELLQSLADDPELSQKAAETGYANRFEACRRAIPWRPVYVKKPTARALQTAIVVGPTGNTVANGADELYTDRLGRIKVQFHWQGSPHADPRADNRSSCWVRVAQRWAGASMGQQFIPRIGQEVLIQFLNNDIDRPVCIDAVYNGKGEGGLARTPGGQPGESDTSVFSQSSDHRPSGQGNLAGGNSPAWHGGAPGPATAGANAQNNAAAMSGVKSKEFGGPGHNQLVFDDTPGQLRVQLATTQHASQLNLGWNIHQADNMRGSFRGQGFELRTDAYGAIRATQGLLITSYGGSQSDPAGDNAPGMALLKQAMTLADSFSQAAKTHQTTTLATSVGTVKASASGLSDKLAPMKALHQAVSGMVSQAGMDAAISDAGNKSTQATNGKLPHTTDPIVAITAKAGLAVVAGQDIQFASGEAISWQAGQDIHIAGGNQLRVNTGQSIGILAGAVQPGDGAKGKGLTMIAAQGPVQMQAQAGQAEVAAKGLINVQSAVGAVEWASAKKITLQTAGGAQIVIAGAGITAQCPGKITVKAATKSFVGPGSESYPIAEFPDATLSPLKRKAAFSLGALPGSMQNYSGEPYTLYADGGVLQKGLADTDGSVMWEHKEGTKTYRVELLSGQSFEIDALAAFRSDSADRLANEGFRSFKHEAGQKADYGAEDEDFRRRLATGKNDGEQSA